MSKTDRSIVSRRAALKSGGVAALAASLLTVGAPVSAATPPAADPHMADLAVESLATLAEYRAAESEHRAAAAALLATLSPQQRELYLTLEAAANDRDAMRAMVTQREMARHLPGLSPALDLVWRHVEETDPINWAHCCTPDERL